MRRTNSDARVNRRKLAMNVLENRRILFVDDLTSIHTDFRKILAKDPAEPDIEADETLLFGATTPAAGESFEMDSAFQGEEALHKLRASLKADRPYAMAFIDMRMPPGWDGVETVEHLWAEDPRLQVVFCTAHSDYSWKEVLNRLDVRDRLLILKKPFDAIEVYQFASALTAKWTRTEQAAFKMNNLEEAVAQRTQELSNANIIVQNSPVILYRLRGEPNFPLIYVSENISKWGHDPQTLKNSSDWAKGLIHTEDRPKVDEAMMSTLQSDAQGASIEFRLRAGDGSLHWVENRYIPVRDSQGRLVEVEGIVIDITERKAAEERIARLARTDGLTQLANRATFVERLRHTFAAAKRGALPFAVHYLDLDKFKPVNDTLGHAAGDLLLREVARRLEGCTRETDLIARLGGDEFAVLQGEVKEPANAGELAARMHAALARPYNLNGEAANISVSIGICFFGAGIADADAMLAQADLALYRSKDEGRNQYHFHSVDLDREVLERVALGSELLNAMTRHELELYYQPQVELSSGKIVGMEALVRWIHPTRGVLAPDVFIPIAERTGSIISLGHWILDRACRQLRLWRDQGFSLPLIAVNLSHHQLKHGQIFIRDVAGVLAKWGLSPSDLEFDVTETTLTQLRWTGNDVLPLLRGYGVKIAIDGFGSEYSSFDYIKEYRVNSLKIAPSYLQGLAVGSEAATAMRTVLEFAGHMGIAVIVQGVETEQQRILLKRTDSGALAQGFHFSRPVNAETAGELLRFGCILPTESIRGGEQPEADKVELGVR
jgi:diguanylate cyclase (GGDEF)-like protein/PAS domain S-box-containing protein